jgi:fatty acid-binding protein DegV
MERLCAQKAAAHDGTVYVQHAGMPQLAQTLVKTVREALGPQQKVAIEEAPLVIGAHIGPGTVGLVFLSDANESALS